MAGRAWTGVTVERARVIAMGPVSRTSIAARVRGRVVGRRVRQATAEAAVSTDLVRAMFLASRATPARLVGRVLGYAQALSVFMQGPRSPVSDTRYVERSVAGRVPRSCEGWSLVLVHRLGVDGSARRGKTRPRLLVWIDGIEALDVSETPGGRCLRLGTRCTASWQGHA